jgi:phthiocerol/phenolphthiocerol synthesis type-I polyketide synthase C
MKTGADRIAICGMACRFPGGANSPEEFWELLHAKANAVSTIPDHRWTKDHFHSPFNPNRHEPGKSYVWAAGIIDDFDRFDAAFFGISPREAEQMDPQQRLLLELAWEACENGGLPPSRLAGSACGVFVGVTLNDYACLRIGDPSSANAYYMTGGSLSIASNRLSYVFDLHGPSFSVDTACSSSLVALHLACQSLRTGEVPAALVGGVNALLNPGPFIGFSAAQMLSPDGACRAFDAGANGYVRAEGGAVLLLKPLAQAVRDGNVIHAVIRATGVNSDGRTNGISLPNDRAQEALLRAVYEGAGLSPKDVGYVEAHGTGTAAGDPLELSALGRYLGAGRGKDGPLLVGSVKTNIGHLESASGVAGVMKVILALQKGRIPANLHFETPNPNIPFDELHLKVVERETAIDPSRAPLMGVSSFSFGGTNAHIVLQGFPKRPERPRRRKKGDLRPPLFLSARSREALKAQASRFASVIRDEGPEAFYDIAYSAAFHRDLHPHRLVVHGNSPDEVVRSLQLWSAGQEVERCYAGCSLGKVNPVAFVFSGNGSQWQGMGRELLTMDPARRAIRAMGERFEALSGWSLEAELLRDEDQSRLDLTEVAQPCLAAVQVGLLALLEAHGVHPQAVLGHSVGEVTAAYACGALSLDQMVRVVFERSQAQGTTRGLGRMAAVGLSADRARKVIRPFRETVHIAGINSPASVTLAGPLAALETLCSKLEAEGIFCRILDLDYAFHHPVMDAIQERLLQRLEGLAPASPRLRMISTVSGETVTDGSLDAPYWWRNVREPVLFGPALERLIKEGFTVFLEVGPHPILQTYVHETLRTASAKGQHVVTLKRASSERIQFERALAELHVLANAADRAIHFPVKGRFRPLPTYPWQRERYWYAVTSEDLNVMHPVREYPLLGYRRNTKEWVWENQIDVELFPFLKDHCLDDDVVFPAAAYVEMALDASAVHCGISKHQIDELEIQRVMVLEPNKPRMVRLALTPDDRTFTVESRHRLMDEPWTLHAVGRLAGSPLGETPAPVPIPDFSRMLLADTATHYALTRLLRFNYGPAFQGVKAVWVDGREAWVELIVPAEIEGQLGPYQQHPALLDAAFQALFDLLAAHTANVAELTYLPVKFGRILFHRAGLPKYCRARLDLISSRSLLASYQILDDAGRVLMELERCRELRIDASQTEREANWLFDIVRCPKQRVDIPYVAAIPELDLLERVVRNQVEEESVRLGRPRYWEKAAPLIEDFVAETCRRFFKERLPSPEPFTVGEFATRFGIFPDRVPFLQAMLRVMARGNLASDGDGPWRVREPSELPPPVDIWRRLVADFPESLPEWVLLGRTGLFLGGLLTGEVNPSFVRPQEAGDGTREHLLNLSPSMRVIHAGMVRCLEEIVRAWPRFKRLRVLEVGALTGHLALSLSQVLGGIEFEYVLTATEPDAVSALGQQFEARPQFTVARFRADEPPGRGDVEPGLFDVVIVSDALHQMSDLPRSLARIRSLLASHGLLVLAEKNPDVWEDFVFGVEPDWWRHGLSALEPVSRRSVSASWLQALREQGFRDPRCVAERGGAPSHGRFLILAGNPAQAEVSAEAGGAEKRRWLILQDPEGPSDRLGRALRSILEGRGDRVIVVKAGSSFERPPTGDGQVRPTSREDFESLIESLEGEDWPSGIVHLMGLEFEPEASPASLAGILDRRCVSTLHLVQALASRTAAAAPKLWLVTGGATAGSGPDPTAGSLRTVPSQAPLWGMGRVLMNEHPDLAVSLIDLCGIEDPDESTRRLIGEFGARDGEDEIVLSPEGRFVHRLRPWAAGTVGAGSPPENVRLGFTKPGPLAHLKWFSVPRKAPEKGQIEVEVRAAGLNFRDVMWAMGLLGDEAVEKGFAGPTLGMECAGVVTRVGAGVDRFAVGDEVLGFAPSCLARFMVTDVASAMAKPARMSFEEAATIPVAFLTAYYALKHLAHLRTGEKVLIHGAAGGVGLAAVQYAASVGCEIFGTAGSEEKRDFLRLLGVDHVLDSRSLAYADQIMKLTDGDGVDVVLNSLAGEAIGKNLSVLKPFGRFLELGKRDLYANTKVGLRPFRNNIAYHAIDADQLLISQGSLARELFVELMDLFQKGVLRPFVYRTFPGRRAVEAFKHMQLSKHIGKIVLSLGEVSDAADPSPSQKSMPPLRPDGSYLIVGGLGGFGLATARWLAANGAGTLLLMGRRGAEAEEARSGIAEIEALGAKVHVLKADITDAQAFRAAMQGCGKDCPPLKGVIHSAMIIDDGLVRNLDRERFLKVMAPKVLGARHLFDFCADKPLDFFVLYSSATTAIGNPGQASYVAANMYLQALAARRRALGQPALVVSWGPIADAGFLARNKGISQALRSLLGDRDLTAGGALDILGQLIASGTLHAAVADMDWSRLKMVLPALRSPRYAEVLRGISPDAPGTIPGEGLRDKIVSASPEEATALLIDLLRRKVSEVMRWPLEKVDVNQPMLEMGLDSLMGVELHMSLEEVLGMKLAMMTIAQGHSIVEVARKLTAKLKPRGTKAKGGEPLG